MNEKCFGCKLYRTCPAVDSNKYKCIIEHDDIKKILNSNDDSLDSFVFNRDPLEYLSYLGFKDKDNYPPIDSYVMTLTSGFGGYIKGNPLKVIPMHDDRYICLLDERSTHRFLVNKNHWWESIYKITENDS